MEVVPPEKLRALLLLYTASNAYIAYIAYTAYFAHPVFTAYST